MRKRAAVFATTVALVVAVLTLLPHLMTNLVGGAGSGSREASAAPTSCPGYSYSYGTNNATTSVVTNAPPIIVYGQTTTITAFLYNNCLDGSHRIPLAGKNVQIQRRFSPSDAWSQFANRVTGSDGSASATDNPSQTAYYRTVFLGSLTARPTGAPYLASSSNSVQQLVRIGIPIVPINAMTRVNRTISFSGQVLPAKPGKWVALQLYDGVNRVWRYVGQKVFLDSNSRYSLPYVAHSAFKLLFRAVYPTQDTLNFWNVSRGAWGTWS